MIHSGHYALFSSNLDCSAHLITAATAVNRCHYYQRWAHIREVRGPLLHLAHPPTSFFFSSFPLLVVSFASHIFTRAISALFFYSRHLLPRPISSSSSSFLSPFPESDSLWGPCGLITTAGTIRSCSIVIRKTLLLASNCCLGRWLVRASPSHPLTGKTLPIPLWQLSLRGGIREKQWKTGRKQSGRKSTWKSWKQRTIAFLYKSLKKLVLYAELR